MTDVVRQPMFDGACPSGTWRRRYGDPLCLRPRTARSTSPVVDGHAVQVQSSAAT